MAAGKITLQANDGKLLSLVAPEGMSEDTVGTAVTAESPTFTGTPTVDGNNIAHQGILAYDNNTSSYIPNTLASGAIIERGSNANGEYIKYADGTLICFKYGITTGNINVPSGTMFSCDYILISPAAAFKVGTYPIFLGSARGGVGLFSVEAQVSDHINIAVSVLSALSFNYGTILDIALIGRWK